MLHAPTIRAATRRAVHDLENVVLEVVVLIAARIATLLECDPERFAARSLVAEQLDLIEIETKTRNDPWKEHQANEAFRLPSQLHRHPLHARVLCHDLSPRRRFTRRQNVSERITPHVGETSRNESFGSTWSGAEETARRPRCSDDSPDRTPRSA